MKRDLDFPKTQLKRYFRWESIVSLILLTDNEIRVAPTALSVNISVKFYKLVEMNIAWCVEKRDS